jgi:dTDP-4-dehydrorhamnose 3,5-epimerase
MDVENKNGVLVIKPVTDFTDFRGKYLEIYNVQEYFDSGIKINFVTDDISISHRGVLRGIHGDDKTYKLISCLTGTIYVVIVNCDEKSDDFGKWQNFVLSDDNRIQLLVPPKYGVAHLIISDKAVFHYKQSEYYNRSNQFTYRWNDTLFNIRWPTNNPILSERDSIHASPHSEKHVECDLGGTVEK